MNHPHTHSPRPFQMRFSPQIPELLKKLNCTLALSTFQAGKVVMISAKNDEELVQLPRSFEKPMGIAVDHHHDRIALACKDEVVICSNSSDLAKAYPNKPGVYDSLYLPVAAHFTGGIDLHDLSWGQQNELYAVNTLFSCIVKLDNFYNFTPVWVPPFITELASEDRCHLNGMAMMDGKPGYATAFNKGNKIQNWREDITRTGLLMDITTNEFILEGLNMPHSPRIFNGQLYLLLSGTGQVLKVNPANGTYEEVTRIKGFVRGMACHNGYLFVGLSKLRKNSSTFAHLDVANFANECGIQIIHLETGGLAGEIIYQMSVDEIYDVEVLPGKIRPNILNTLTEDYKKALLTPTATYWGKPKQEM